MFLSINEGKITELLNSTDKMYAVESVPIAAENFSNGPMYPTTTEVSGIVYAPLLVTEETKENLMSLRRQIEESGVRLKTAEQLTKEIDEMRGKR
ncbi:MAG: hypothetical protein JWN74_2225 [Acidobacteriaceae bacterium]|nr:hypothetical protein [Acidobacteriaceae bacterium]